MHNHLLCDRLKRFMKEEDGATAIEYSIMAAILGIAIVGTVGSIRNSLNGTFEAVSQEMANNNG